MTKPASTSRLRFAPFRGAGPAMVLAAGALLLPFAAAQSSGTTATSPAPAIKLRPASQSGGSATPAVPMVPAQPAVRLTPGTLAPATATGATGSAAAPAPGPRSKAAGTPAADEVLAPTVVDATTAALAAGEAADLDGLWFAALAAHGGTELLLQELAARAAEGDANAHWLTAGIQRREGRFDDAKDALEEYLDQVDSFRAQYERATLMDARGKTARARKAYEDLAKDLGEAPEGAAAGLLEDLRLRLAFLAEETADDFGEALSTLALDRPEDFRRRAAVVLGLRKAPAKAMDLYVVEADPEGTDPEAPSTRRFRQEARLAEWALQADDAVRAQSWAWDAVRSAKLGRDRSYGLTLLVEAYRADDSIGVLIDRLAGHAALSAEAGEELPFELRDTWIELLREEGRVDEAIELFRSDAELDVETRQRLLEMYREDGRTDEMVAAYRERIEREPDRLTWRAGLSRFYLERGDRGAAEEVWRSFVSGVAETGLDDESLLVGFDLLADQGLDDLAVEVAERAIAAERGHLAACLRLFGLHQARGDLERAEASLERMQALAAPEAPERMDLGEAWERLGRLDRAVEVLEGVVEARGASESGEDLAMHLAWLYSETGNEDRALEAWRELWHRVNAVSRRRYVEDRLMTVASRLGSLADIAIDLEEKLLDGSADAKETGLLVRLYSKVGDPVSATEVIDEFLRGELAAGAVEGDAELFERTRLALEEKARVYLSCLDYYNYERTVDELIELDPEGEPDYLRQLAMSMLERGKPADAREILARLKHIEADLPGSDAAEFEAGVLSLAGLREDAVRAYLQGIAENPNRIESWLLLGNLMEELGEKNRAIRIFQHLAEDAEQDDLFTIAIDGLLNLEADAGVMAWAQRITWERLAARSDKAYLYQLCADLAEAGNDDEGVRVALESSLSIAGERRSSILRELIDRSAGTRTPWGERQGGDEELELAYSRRLVGLKEIVPPDVFLSIGEAFLAADDPTGAMRTFRMATDLPDRGAYERQVAASFEVGGYPEEALDAYERVLAGEPTNAGLLVKVAELHERLGRGETAHGIYAQGLELLLGRLPVVSTKGDQRASDTARGAFGWWGARNIDDFDRYFDRARLGYVATLPPLDGAEVGAVVQGQLEAARADLAAGLAAAADLEDDEPLTLARLPRALRRSNFARGLAFALDRGDGAAALDRELLAGLPDDEALLERLLRERLRAGRVADARGLLVAAPRPDEERDRLRFLVGLGTEDGLPLTLSLDETRGLILPLFIEGRNDDAALLLARTNLAGLSASEVDGIGALLSAAVFLEDPDLCLRLGREWMRLLFEAGVSEWQLRPVMQKLENILEPDDFRGLVLYLAQKAAEDPEKGAAALAFLPELQKRMDEPLFTPDELLELLDGREDLGYGYGIPPVLQLLPEDMQPSALRSVLPRVRDMGRNWFLSDLVTQATEDLPGGVVEVILDTYPDAIADQEEEQLSWRMDQFGQVENNLETALAMVRIAQKQFPGISGGAASSIELLDKLGREDEALAVAREVWPTLIGGDDPTDWTRQQALRAVEDYLAEHDLDALLALLEESEGDEDLDGLRRRMDLLWRNDRQDEALALVEAALAGELEVDDRAAMLQSRRGYLQSMGRRLEAMEVLAELAELQPDERRHKQQLVSSWRSMRNPIRALDVRLTIEPEDEPADEQDAALQALGLPAGFSLPPGSQIVINGQLVVIGEESGKTKDVATIQRVKEAADEGDHEAAQALLRRLWRQFQEGIDPANRFSFGGRGPGWTPTWSWPRDPEEDAVAEAETEDAEAEPQRRHRGGLDRYEEPAESKPREVRSAYDELARYDFGRDEMLRILATRAPEALDSDTTRALLEGLLGARIEASSPTAVRDELLDRVVSGQAGKADHVMLLSLLDEHADLLDERTQEVLRDLARTLQAGDLGPLRALARLHARRGSLAEATRLYRWCATKVQPIGYWAGDDEVLIPAQSLLEEVRTSLSDDRDALVQVVEDIVHYAGSGDDRFGRGEAEVFALDTWTKVLDGAEALERLRDDLAVISNTEFEAAPPRRLAMAALPLYLKAGEIDRALVCLEVALCTFDRDLFPSERYLWPDPTRPGYLGRGDLAKLYPADPAAALGVEALDEPMTAAMADWYQRSAEAMTRWLADERVNANGASQVVALAAWRLADLADFDGSERAGALAAAALEAWDDDALSSHQTLWLVDAARLAGRDDLADATQRALFEAGDLHTERLADVVRAALETEGPMAALELAEEPLTWCLHPELLEAARDAAEGMGHEQRKMELDDLIDEAEAARAELERLDEEERARREAAAAKDQG